MSIVSKYLRFEDFKSFFSKRFDQLALPIIVALGIVTLVLLITPQDARDTLQIEFSDDSVALAHDSQLLFIDVSGAIQKPGLYQVIPGTRVGELIDFAGGLIENVDQQFVAEQINLAEQLVDGMKVYIPFDSLPAATMSSTSAQGLVDINLASQSELETLPGVGPATAGKIIQNRPYAAIEDIMLVPGISTSRFDALKDLIGV